MKKALSKKIENLLKTECVRQNIPYKKAMLRLGRRTYHTLTGQQRKTVG